MARSNSIRIIGGEFRGRRLGFPDAPGLRPTADRLRETLFNWLQGKVEAADCLDPFAGSGALGLEALSRGAKSVRFIEQARTVARQLERNLQLLGVEERAQLYMGNALGYLDKCADRQFDIVFLDPPFVRDWLTDVCARLERNGWLKPVSWIYLEQEHGRDWPELPHHWHIYRQAKAGQAACMLVRRDTMSG